jgi:geranyl-CoA carboxylase alpha subunit
VPGYQGEDQSEATLVAEAAKIGFPVMIKATAGGGGRGMRLVHDAASFADALRSAQSEAQARSASDCDPRARHRQPRHIEIQVFADRHGNAIHLGERDCSVQRRHQKVIEEAPSPAVDPTCARAWAPCAVAAVQGDRLREGAGTLEFLLEAAAVLLHGDEHAAAGRAPGDRGITGLDLVDWQLRVAAASRCRSRRTRSASRPRHRGAPVRRRRRPRLHAAERAMLVRVADARR